MDLVALGHSYMAVDEETPGPYSTCWPWRQKN